jgi:hypothetical protein
VPQYELVFRRIGEDDEIVSMWAENLATGDAREQHVGRRRARFARQVCGEVDDADDHEYERRDAALPDGWSPDRGGAYGSRAQVAILVMITSVATCRAPVMPAV